MVFLEFFPHHPQKRDMGNPENIIIYGQAFADRYFPLSDLHRGYSMRVTQNLES
jgi:hypothetical protein